MMDTIIKSYNRKLMAPADSKQHDASTGIEKVAKELIEISDGRLEKQLSGILVPQRELIVMIVGNHSAGKSSFINWYVDEPIQRAKVSIETVEINLIMQGNEREDFSGHNAIKMLPFLGDLLNRERKTELFPGLLENMTLKTSTSTSRNFSNIIFIDTPGLADGNLRYKFDVEGSIEWFACKSDLILVFLDPQGQALCKRTMKIVKELYDQQLCENKVHFVMTKGDVFETDDDRLKCMCQITQSLATVLPPMHGFAMPIISLPGK